MITKAAVVARIRLSVEVYDNMRLRQHARRIVQRVVNKAFSVSFWARRYLAWKNIADEEERKEKDE